MVMNKTLSSKRKELFDIMIKDFPTKAGRYYRIIKKQDREFISEDVIKIIESGTDRWEMIKEIIKRAGDKLANQCTCSKLIKGIFANCPIHSYTNLDELANQVGLKDHSPQEISRAKNLLEPEDTNNSEKVCECGITNEMLIDGKFRCIDCGIFKQKEKKEVCEHIWVLDINPMNPKRVCKRCGKDYDKLKKEGCGK